MEIKRALISVSDKSDIAAFASELAKLGVEIVSTGGTASLLEDNGIKVKQVSAITNFPEMLDGRVKTLHPKIHGALLALRKNKEHMKQIKEQNIQPIDMVVVNLYPFEETIKQKNVKFEDAIENIDIGGPSMLRSAAKNFEDVIVVTDSNDYSIVLKELKEKGNVSKELRKELARKAFEKTAFYDAMISNFLQGKENDFPEKLLMVFEKKQDMRYGENPHQKAAFYSEKEFAEPSIAQAEQVNGKELSYNNIMDADAALNIVKEFSEPCCSVIKHANPSGVAAAEKIENALEKAYNADPLSAFGCIIALNKKCNLACAEFMRDKFIEVVIAPDYDKDALNLLKEKKKLRVMVLPNLGEFYKNKRIEKFTLKKIVGGLLLQTREYPDFEKLDLKVVTKRKPSEQEIKDMIFACKVNKHVKSNAVLFAKDGVTVGIGAGQMSRVDSSIIAARKAGPKAKGAVMSSDAFFPFRDGIDEAAKAGITAIMQPGGSIRDQEVIDAANEHNIAMVFSGTRLFLH